ncbi:MAG: hypothetical protein QHG99_02355 [Methanomicrobiales archaeon]|nr:hypothetical protein [Methanomicrobiales archaeon]
MVNRETSGAALHLLLVASISLSLIATHASAVVIECTNEYVGEGDTIRVVYRGLPDGAHLSVLIEGELAPEDGYYVLEAAGLFMPASLLNGSIIASAENAASAEISIKKGSSTVSASEESTSGSIRIMERRNVATGIYEQMKIDGSALDRDKKVLARIQLTGEKSGPADAEISFVMRRISEGTVRIVVYVDTVESLNRILPVQRVSPGGGPGPASPGFAVDVAVTPQETATVAATLPHSYGTLIESPDGVLSLRGAIPAGLHILEVKPAEMPAAWRLMTPAYAVSPEGIELEEPLEIVIRLPEGSEEGDVLFIAQLSGHDWRILPSRIDGDRISAWMERTGICALMGMADAVTGGNGVADGGTEARPGGPGTGEGKEPVENPIPEVVFIVTFCVAALLVIGFAWHSWHRRRV